MSNHRQPNSASPLGREVRDDELYAAPRSASLGREVRDDELFASRRSASLGREVRDNELFGAAATASIGREVRDDELFGGPAQKRPRLTSPQAPLLRSRPAPRSASFPDARAVVSPKRPRSPAMPAWERARAAALAAGAFTPARSLKETEARFDPPPWRIGAETKAEERYLGGIMRLSEQCLTQLVTKVRSGAVRDLSELPDDFAYAILTHISMQDADTLVRIETDNPLLLEPIEAAWAHMCSSNYDIDILPPDVASWRALFVRCTRLAADKLKEAAARLRERYAEVTPRFTRQVVALPRSIPPPTRRRRTSRDTDPAYLPPQTLVARLREEMRRRRTRRR